MARSRRKAFTLVELLVVIVILGMLLALLVGGIQSAHEHAIYTQCKWNLHQLWQALQVNETPGFPDPKGWTLTVSETEAAPCLACPKNIYATSSGSERPSGLNVELIAPPPSVEYGKIENDTQILYFIERVNYTLPESVTVDISEPGDYLGGFTKTSTTIPAGTLVNSTFLFYDPAQTSPTDRRDTSGWITMSNKILGVICVNNSLNKTDAVLGRPGTIYPTNVGNRGLEAIAGDRDHVALKDDRRTFVFVYISTLLAQENVRILTEGSGAEGSSYGMNNQIKSTGSSPGQILLLEYGRSTVDVDGLNADGKSEDDDFYNEVAPRHFGLVNVLFVEGNVESFSPEEIDPRYHPNLWKP